MSVALVNPPPAKTPLAPWHAAHRGRLVEFSGWLMPVQYESIVAEHQAVRRGLGLFDVSHMGRLKFTGPAAQAFLDSLLTRRVSDLDVGQVRYSLMTNDAGGILDDVLVYRLASSATGESDYCLLVVNAGNRGKIVDWIRAHLAGPDVQFTDLTEQTAMIAVQGPAALRGIAAAGGHRSGGDEILSCHRVASLRPAGDRQPHRVYRRRWLRSHRVGGGRGSRLGSDSRRGKTGSAPLPRAWEPATRCGWKRRCRCTATNYRKRSIR